MSKKLAIQGHSTRGKEVIELLKMMGGTNPFSNNGELLGNKKNCYYYISKNVPSKYISWNYIGPEEIDKYVIFTLEEFLEKYPFKVGDKVNTVYGGCDGTIKEMKWVDNEVKYRLDFGHLTGEWYSANELQSIKEKENMEEKKINQMSLANCDLDEVEIVLGDKFELKIEDGKYYAVRKKPKYPTTYDDCCDMLNANEFVGHELMTNFPKLINARNAYWKIAGEQMGLDKPWEPDFTNDDEERYGIYTAANKVVKDFCGVGDVNTILTFPFEEMRDAFYKNFDYLIEACKELL